MGSIRHSSLAPCPMLPMLSVRGPRWFSNVGGILWAVFRCTSHSPELPHSSATCEMRCGHAGCGHEWFIRICSSKERLILQSLNKRIDLYIILWESCWSFLQHERLRWRSIKKFEGFSGHINCVLSEGLVWSNISRPVFSQFKRPTREVFFVRPFSSDPFFPFLPHINLTIPCPHNGPNGANGWHVAWGFCRRGAGIPGFSGQGMAGKRPEKCRNQAFKPPQQHWYTASTPCHLVTSFHGSPAQSDWRTPTSSCQHWSTSSSASAFSLSTDMSQTFSLAKKKPLFHGFWGVCESYDIEESMRVNHALHEDMYKASKLTRGGFVFSISSVDKQIVRFKQYPETISRCCMPAWLKCQRIPTYSNNACDGVSIIGGVRRISSSWAIRSTYCRPWSLRWSQTSRSDRLQGAHDMDHKTWTEMFRTVDLLIFIQFDAFCILEMFIFQHPRARVQT